MLSPFWAELVVKKISNLITIALFTVVEILFTTATHIVTPGV